MSEAAWLLATHLPKNLVRCPRSILSGTVTNKHNITLGETANFATTQ